MQHLTLLLLTIVLLAIVIQDIKYRAIHFMLPVLLCIVAVIRFFMFENNPKELIGTVVFLGLVLIGLFVYISVKEKKILNPVDTFIGMGDLVFFIAIMPLFFSTAYILFFCSGMLFSVFCHVLFTKNKAAHVPLAGYLSVYLILVFIADFCIEKELFYTHNILI